MSENGIWHCSFDIHRSHQRIVAALPDKGDSNTEDQATAKSDAKRNWIVRTDGECSHLSTIHDRDTRCMNPLADTGFLQLREEVLVKISIGKRFLCQHLELYRELA